MAISYALAPMPKWLIADQVGQLAGGAQLFTYDNLNPTQPKATYKDIGGTFPQTNPIVFDLNGSAGPIYWEVDPTNPNDLYYIRAYDAQNNFLWDVQNFTPGGGSGGGNITTFVNTTNYIANNVFLNNCGALNLSTTVSATIAPSNHQGFVSNNSATGGLVAPDMIFYKNVTTATDSISFPTFAAGVSALAPDNTPPFYLEYISTGTTGELQKFFQFPICAGVKNLAGQNMTFTCCVQSGLSTTTNVFTAKFRQYFGSGGSPSADVLTLIGSKSIGTGWQKLTFNFTVPLITGTTLGDCGDDASYVQIIMPTNTPCDVCFVKPCLYMGTLTTTTQFETNDQIDAVVQSARTGDVRLAVNGFQPYGWVPSNNGTIGSATSNASTRANIDTFPLFSTIWTAMSTNQTYAPMFTSAGANVSYGASAIADFVANNQISLTKTLGYTLAGTASSVPASQNFTVNTGVSLDNLTVTNAVEFGKGTPVVLSTTGTLPTGLFPAPTVYFTRYSSMTVLDLYPTPDDAIANTNVITFSTNGTGTHSIKVYESGFIYEGHDDVNLASTSVQSGAGSTVAAAAQVNITNPRTFMNVFFKL